MAEAYFVGLELNEKDVRICVYDSEKKEAVSVMTGADGNLGDSPAHMTYDKESAKWYYGIEAEHVAGQKGTELYSCVYEKCLRDEMFDVNGEKVESSVVLAELVRQALEQAGISNPKRDIHMLVITVPIISQKLIKVTEKAFEQIGFSKEQAYLQDYNESFFVHTYYQKQEVYNRSTGLYYFPDETRIIFKSLYTDMNARPATASVVGRMETELPTAPRARDAAFCDFIRKTTEGEEYSGFFLVGKGFERYWAKESIMMLGKNQRKIFYGNNLFAKGACYSAIEKAKKAKLNNVIYLGNDFIRKNIGMELIVDSKLSYYPLIKSGIHWFEAEASCEIIVNGADKLVFSVSSMENGKKTDFAMMLDDMPKRPPKTTRLKVTLRFEERDRCEVTVEDMGFGEMFPSSGKIWHDYL